MKHRKGSVLTMWRKMLHDDPKKFMEYFEKLVAADHRKECEARLNNYLDQLEAKRIN